VLIEEMCKALSPCPFCGESLVVHEDHHGKWIAHNYEPHDWCPCGVVQIHDLSGMTEWNTRLLDREDSE